MPEELDIKFHEAVALASEMSQADLPQDIQLRLYAFYKQATLGTPSLNYNSGPDLRNAFKTNAWMQISNMSADEAKQAYIDIITTLHKKQ